jgi:hypothetical protein
MSTNTIQELLALIEKPSRYLGSEINAVKKDPQGVKLRFALAFPDLYEIGTSHFGLQILYHILNRRPEIAAERVFAPATDLENRLRQGRTPLFSLESQTPLNRFDIIGFSLLYELNYTNILTMLELSGIPALAGDRDPGHPLVVAGGPCTCNPEPVADFFDAIVVGDGEQVVLELARTWLEWKDAGSGDRELLLKIWAAIEGVYIPAFFEARYDADGFQTVAPRSEHTPVKRAVVADLDAAPFPVKPVIRSANLCTTACGWNSPGLHPRVPVLPGGNDLPPGAGALSGQAARTDGTGSRRHRLRGRFAHVPQHRGLRLHRAAHGAADGALRT